MDRGSLRTNDYMALKQLGDRLVQFTGGDTGMWRVLAIRPVLGDTLPQTERVAVCRGNPNGLYPALLATFDM